MIKKYIILMIFFTSSMTYFLAKGNLSSQQEAELVETIHNEIENYVNEELPKIVGIQDPNYSIKPLAEVVRHIRVLVDSSLSLAYHYVVQPHIESLEAGYDFEEERAFSFSIQCLHGIRSSLDLFLKNHQCPTDTIISALNIILYTLENTTSLEGLHEFYRQSKIQILSAYRNSLSTNNNNL